MTATSLSMLAAVLLTASAAVHPRAVESQSGSAIGSGAPEVQTQIGRVRQPSDEQVVIEFDQGVQAYMKLHREMAQQVPNVSNSASMEEIDRSQRLLLQRLAAARAGATQGALFTPPMEALVRRILVQLFEQAEGRQLRDSIMDENPTFLTLKVNDRYPDSVPMSTMPPALLAALPSLPEELEYRFVGDNLVIVDVPAHLVVDFLPHALPK